MERLNMCTCKSFCLYAAALECLPTATQGSLVKSMCAMRSMCSQQSKILPLGCAPQAFHTGRRRLSTSESTSRDRLSAPHPFFYTVDALGVVLVVKFSKNFGHPACIARGLVFNEFVYPLTENYG